ncbi:unnamed protein product [Macrosiphum euphorbiae]|uniref:Uncharacterized protein n=1 Tax=Macrosiphum euphorbiae TaxID=13131 RepID=A0AAV0XCT8_9HEMI|nr:unnamed protein product [Macrosiphum euphorbiae]
MEALEMSKMLKISWRERKSNIEVLTMIEEPRQIIKMMKIRKAKFFKHIMRHNTLITNIMEGKINRKRGRGRPRETNFGNMKKLLSLEDWLKRQGDIAFR